MLEEGAGIDPDNASREDAMREHGLPSGGKKGDARLSKEGGRKSEDSEVQRVDTDIEAVSNLLQTTNLTGDSPAQKERRGAHPFVWMCPTALRR